MKKRLDLNIVANTNCRKNCSKEVRNHLTDNDLCLQANSVIDELPLRCVREWGINKIYHLVQYFGIFSNGMKNKWSGNLNYIEICSGPGRCISRENGEEFDGTSLSILKHNAYKHLHTALFFDFNEEVIETLKQRIKALNINNAFALIGDYNYPQGICNEIVKNVRRNSLNLVFIDPTDCSVPFILLKEINKALPNVDYIINIATGSDFNRNINDALLKPENFKKSIAKYSRFLGSSYFFNNDENINLATQKKNTLLRNNFRESYKNSLAGIGYKHFDVKQIKHYDLLFASKHETGLKFWKEANKSSLEGQRQLF